MAYKSLAEVARGKREHIRNAAAVDIWGYAREHQTRLDSMTHITEIRKRINACCDDVEDKFREELRAMKKAKSGEAYENKKLKKRAKYWLHKFFRAKVMLNRHGIKYTEPEGEIGTQIDEVA